jgi:hypothetical protein
MTGNMPPVHAALQGLTAAARTVDRCAERLGRASSDAGDSVSLSEDAVALLAARNAYEMNLRVLSDTDEMAKKLVDILA